MAKLFKLLSNNTFALNESVIKEETRKMTRELAMRIASSLTPQELQDMTDWLKELSFADVDADDLDDIAKEEPWKIVMVVANSYDGGLSAWWKDSINEIDINVGDGGFPEPDSNNRFGRFRMNIPKNLESDPFKDVSKQISQMRMNKPKGPELRKERYMRIAANVDQAEFEEMMHFVATTLWDDAESLGKDDSYEDIYNEVKQVERWEILMSIDNIYSYTGQDGLAKWKKDHNSPWDL
jgi:hypothetical protein